jgi:hypothetical protein
MVLTASELLIEKVKMLKEEALLTKYRFARSPLKQYYFLNKTHIYALFFQCLTDFYLFDNSKPFDICTAIKPISNRNSF